MNRQPNPTSLLMALVGVLAALLFSMSIYTIESGTVGVLSTFGRYSKLSRMPGLNFKIPIVQKVFILDTKMQTANYMGTDKDVDTYQGVIVRRQVEVLDSKNLQIGLQLSIQFTPSYEEASMILSQYGKNYFDKLINPLIRDNIRDVVANYQAEEIALNRSLIVKELQNRLTKNFVDIPFELNGVQLRSILLPEVVKKKIEDVQLAKQEEQRLAMVEKQQEQNKKNKRIEAEGEAKKKQIEADAMAYKILKEAEALALANKRISDSITSELIRYESIKKWSGHYPSTLLAPGDKGQNFLLQLPLSNE